MKSKDHDTSDLHNHSYIDQSCRNRHRLRRSIWTACRPASRRLDKVVSHHRGGDDRDRLLLSLSWSHARDRSWHRIAAFSSPYHFCTLSQTTRRTVAMDLCDGCRDLSVF